MKASVPENANAWTNELKTHTKKKNKTNSVPDENRRWKLGGLLSLSNTAACRERQKKNNKKLITIIKIIKIIKIIIIIMIII